jgi:hypothetical protein
MTALVAWIGVDSRGPSSVYLAADSRLSWPDGSVWDQGRKLFAAQTKPDILGYCGDALFPSQTIGQVIAAIDGGALDECVTADDRVCGIREMVEASLRGYPAKFRKPFSILYCTRQGQGMKSSMSCHEITLKNGVSVTSVTPICVPDRSGVIAFRGSGALAAEKWIDFWFASGQAGGRTSRAVFSGFCDAVHSGEDTRTGGAPQLVGLFRAGPANTFGVSWNGQPFVYGLSVGSSEMPGTEWRNRLFEVSDQRGVRLAGAQPQPRPNDIPHP